MTKITFKSFIEACTEEIHEKCNFWIDESDLLRLFDEKNLLYIHGRNAKDKDWIKPNIIAHEGVSLKWIARQMFKSVYIISFNDDNVLEIYEFKRF